MRPSQNFAVVLVVAAVVSAGALGACGTASSLTEPEAVSALDHRGSAEDHERRARAPAVDQDPDTPSRPRTFQFPVVRRIDAESDRLGDTPSDTGKHGQHPATEQLSGAQHHREHAQQHRVAARALETYTDEACRSTPAEARNTCPLLDAVARAEEVEGGLRFWVREGVSPRTVRDHIRCHHAFAREQHYEQMDSCPIYLPKLVVELAEDETIIITSPDAQVVRRLRARVRALAESKEPR